jgi:hypothetical protein
MRRRWCSRRVKADATIDLFVTRDANVANGVSHGVIVKHFTP